MKKLILMSILIATFAIPIVYILYLYDVNLWEDEPIPVVAAAFVLTGVLAAVFTWIWSDRIRKRSVINISWVNQGNVLSALLKK